MKVSVIIPCHNAVDLVGVQLEALATQEFDQPWEVIVVDNRSDDGTADVLAEYCDRIENLRVVKADARAGPGYARNVGAATAEGEILLFCDADDEVAPGWVAAMAGAVEKHNFAACRFDARRLSGAEGLRLRGNRLQVTGLIKYDYVDFFPYAGTGGLGIKRAIHEEVGGFDEDLIYCEDCAYCWKVQILGYTLYFEPNALVHIRQRGTVSGSLRQAWNWGKYNAFLVRKFRGRGFPRVRMSDVSKNWYVLVKRGIRIRSSDDFYRWLWAAAFRLGRLRGCFRFRVFAP